MKRSWIILVAVVALVALFFLTSRPFTQSGDEPGQPSPHAITQ
ncbi:hypothetical protein J2858_000881 [Neorhizobium galegae]|nr:hypothetical protein [Neorhizobium galegae]